MLPARALVVVLPLMSCSVLYDPCGDLDRRICADLGNDCAAFRSTPSIYESTIPQRRRQAERMQCEMFGADENYASYTLPQLKFLIAVQREPSTPRPNLKPPTAAGLSASTASYSWYVVPFVMIPGIFLYSWWMRRNLTKRQPPT